MLIYDIEIKNMVPAPYTIKRPDLVYCDGWEDYENMGISVICAFDTETQRTRVFMNDNFDEFVDLAARHEHIIGWNSKRFDDIVCDAFGIDVQTTYDLREKFLEAFDYHPDTVVLGLSLDTVAKANNLPRKIGHGSEAPMLWQKNCIGQLVDYCINDVHVTYSLFERSQGGPLYHPIASRFARLATIGD